AQGHAQPEEILAVTYTENSAAELKDRVEKRLRRRAAITACNFHAYSLGLLKRHRQDFSLLLPEDVYVFLRQRIERLGLRRFIKPADLGQFLHDLKDFFDRCTEELILPAQFQGWVDGLRPGPDMPRNCRSKMVAELGEQEILERWREIARAYTNSMGLIEDEGLGTFGMMISKAVRLLESDAELLERERGKARFILIDEFQDCNSSNIILADLLAGAEKNIFAVGDPDQAIYRFRGASSAAFEEFQKRFPETQGVVLEENQRSRGNILRVAFAAVSGNPPVPSLGERVRFQRTLLQSGRDRRDQADGRFPFDQPVAVSVASGHEAEAAIIAEEIEQLRRSRRPGERESMAVLYRQHIHREKLMEELAARGIPFIVTGLDVLETGVVRDLLALARAVAYENDAESLFRVCALPQFKVSATDLRQRLAAAHRTKTFKNVLQEMESAAEVLAALRQAREFVQAQKLTAAGAFTYLVRQFGLPEKDPAVQAMLRFVAAWEEKPFVQTTSLTEFLGYMEYYQQGAGIVPMFTEEQMAEVERQNPDAVQLMTVHVAKGLEFTHVWILRVVPPAFPKSFNEALFEFPQALRRSAPMGEGRDVHDQEERRLFYVAITRARDRLTITSRPGRGKDKTPAGYLRPLLTNRDLKAALEVRDGDHAASAQAPAELSPIAGWMLLPPAFNAKEIKLSANAVQRYSTCPLQFKLGRDWNIPGEAAAALQYGSAIHTVLKNYYDPQQAVQSVEEVVAAFRREFAKGVIDDPVQRKMYEDQGEKQLRVLIESCPRGSVDVLAAEHSFTFKIGEQEIVGRIDRLDRLQDKAVRVVDYKTGSPKDNKFAEESLQLSIYAMGVSQMNLMPQELVLLNVQDNSQAVATRTPKQLETARRTIEEVAQGIARSDFEPTPGQHCRWCEYRRLCPATEQRMFIPAGVLAESN
ncbi:MAG TPA: ATP-dependent DNA helicase, partial [Alphaproteobacteria bacterium]|nr:ATP-dependent DNA helicase [Alphaproteobacteria bacterium]